MLKRLNIHGQFNKDDNTITYEHLIPKELTGTQERFAFVETSMGVDVFNLMHSQVNFLVVMDDVELPYIKVKFDQTDES
jgi:hypothetical protein